MKKYFLHVKNMKNSYSSVPSISSQERTPFTVMTSVGRNDDRLCSESGVANLGINNPQLPLNGEGFQGSGFCPPTTNCPPSTAQPHPPISEVNLQLWGQNQRLQLVSPRPSWETQTVSRVYFPISTNEVSRASFHVKAHFSGWRFKGKGPISFFSTSPPL